MEQASVKEKNVREEKMEKEEEEEEEDEEVESKGLINNFLSHPSLKCQLYPSGRKLKLSF